MRFRRNFRNWNKIDVFLIVVIVWLLCILISRQTRTTGARKTPEEQLQENLKDEIKIVAEVEDVKKGEENEGETDDDFLTRDRLKALPDTRSPGCPTSYPRALEHRVSIIMYFYDYQFYDVKTTYRSIRHNTPHDVIKEIILVDAGSTIEYIRMDAEKFAKSAPKVRLLHTSIRESPTRARHFGADHASSSVLVFVDSNAICNRGWLEPLIDAIDRNPQSVSIPHYDHMEDLALNIYRKVAQRHVYVFSWLLTTLYLHGDGTEPGVDPYPTPVIRGSVFAIKAQFYKALGELDEEFSQPGGEMLEFSLRTWMCGGALQIVPCSRVGLLDLYDSQPIRGKHNVARLISMWFETPHSDVINRYLQNDVQLNTDQLNGIAVRKGGLLNLQCKNSEWYLQKFKDIIASPTDFDAVARAEAEFGYLKGESGRCARVSDDELIIVDGCPNMVYKKDMIFEYLKGGQVVVDGKCVTVVDTYHIRAKPCKHGDNTQLWKRTPSGELRVASNAKACATHVTEPGDGKRQILMVQRCNKNGSTLFTRFDFFLQ